ncbi:MAG TPA: hypothetical protein VNK89_00930 [Thermoflexus sp.]|nr:hypothetical protein [Thermoflexus sp.]
MPFTVEDFQDLLVLLQRHPEWRAQLWAALAGEELLRLPGEFTTHRQEFTAFRAETDRRFAELAQAVQSLAEAQRRHYEEFAAFRAEADRRFAELSQAVQSLAEAQRRHYEEFAAFRAEADRRWAETDRRFAELSQAVQSLAEAQRRHYEEFAALREETDRRFAELAEAQRRTEAQIAQLTEAQRRTQEEVREYRGPFIEMKYRERPHAYFHRIVQRPRRVEPDELEDLLEGRALEPSEEDRLRETDLLLRGRREGRETWLAVEISYGIGPGDVRRALRSAEALRKLGIEALPVVAGVWLTAEAEAEARGRVWRVLDGRVYPPEAEAPTGSAAEREDVDDVVRG